MQQTTPAKINYFSICPFCPALKKNPQKNPALIGRANVRPAALFILMDVKAEDVEHCLCTQTAQTDRKLCDYISPAATHNTRSHLMYRHVSSHHRAQSWTGNILKLYPERTRSQKKKGFKRFEFLLFLLGAMSENVPCFSNRVITRWEHYNAVLQLKVKTSHNVWNQRILVKTDIPLTGASFRAFFLRLL